MFLPNTEIADQIHKKNLLIDPFDQKLLRPASYLLRLSNAFVRFKTATLVDVIDGESIKQNAGGTIQQDSIVVQPHEFLLASSIEKIGIPNGLLGLIAGLSHLGRLGLAIHSTSPLINPGFGWQTPSCITFEIFSYNS